MLLCADAAGITPPASLFLFGSVSVRFQALRSRTPVVVMEGSGRAADVLSYAWRLLHDQQPLSRKMSMEGLRELIEVTMLPDSVRCCFAFIQWHIQHALWPQDLVTSAGHFSWSFQLVTSAPNWHMHAWVGW